MFTEIVWKSLGSLIKTAMSLKIPGNEIKIPTKFILQYWGYRNTYFKITDEGRELLPANSTHKLGCRISSVYTEIFKHRWLGVVFQCNFLGDIIPPGITIVAQAVRSDNRNQGYQATAYARSDAAKVDVQLVVVQLAETNWKACADAVILPLKAQVSTQAALLRVTSKSPEIFKYRAPDD